MIRELFEVFPEYIAFHILTYTPHITVDIIRKHWHQSRMVDVLDNINNLSKCMEKFEEDTGVPFGFYVWYMYNYSPQWFQNQQNPSELTS
jgi:hypothetical protein